MRGQEQRKYRSRAGSQGWDSIDKTPSSAFKEMQGGSVATARALVSITQNMSRLGPMNRSPED